MTVNDGTAKWELFIIANTVDVDNAKNNVTNSINNIKVTAYTTPKGEYEVVSHGYGSITDVNDCTKLQCKSYVSNTAGISAGTFTLQNLLQQLVTKSHSHSFRRAKYKCNCDCD